MKKQTNKNLCEFLRGELPKTFTLPETNQNAPEKIGRNQKGN